MGDRRSQPLLRAAIGGLLAGFAPAAAGPWLMVPALALLWSVVDRQRLAAGWGLIAVLISHRWLLALHPLTWMGVPGPLSLPIAISIWLFCGVCAALLLCCWSLLAKLLLRLRPIRLELGGAFWCVSVLACLWGLVEVWLSAGPLFWIGVGGSALPADPALAGLGRWIGAGGLAAVQLILGWGLWAAVAGRRFLPWGGVIVTSFVVLHGLGAASLPSMRESSGSLVLAAWQSAIPTREKFNIERQRRLPALIRDALRQAEAMDAKALVVPEGTLPPRGGLAVPEEGIPLLGGGFRWVRGEQRSSLLLHASTGGSDAVLLDKHRLVPLGEALPTLPLGMLSGLSAVGGLHPGTPSRFFDGFDPPGGAAICYEISDGRALAAATASGARWLLAIANLDPYPVLLQDQFLALAQLRAIETGRDLLSVANTGPTAMIRGDSRVELLLAPEVGGVARAEVQLRSEQTFYVRWREGPLLAVLLMALIGWSRPFSGYGRDSCAAEGGGGKHPPGEAG